MGHCFKFLSSLTKINCNMITYERKLYFRLTSINYSIYDHDRISLPQADIAEMLTIKQSSAWAKSNNAVCFGLKKKKFFLLISLTDLLYQVRLISWLLQHLSIDHEC